jgi:hypothetical protein
VVVALDLERDRLPLAQVEDAGVLAGPLQDARPGRRQPLQQPRRVLVAAVLRPEEREDGELEVVRVPGQQLADSVQLPVGEAEDPVERLFRDGRQRAESRRGIRRRPSGGDVAVAEEGKMSPTTSEAREEGRWPDDWNG